LDYASSYGLGIDQMILSASRITFNDIGVTLNITDLASQIFALCTSR